ncbi:MAG: flippase-like domain-containing protein [Bacteroidales bacterium]|nr:flippase-like domain-containing protein [Bacteroidales bacterium]MBN2756527.1 flippase-like domain-containing protein [Bacteroidales bacterium]
MPKKNENISNKINPVKIIFPVLIGLGFVAFMLFRSFDVKAFDVVVFSKNTFFWLAIAIILMLFRDLGYILRLRILTGNAFSFKKALRVIMLWEFSSAITPSAVGGTGLAIIYVNKEGLGIGKSSAVVMATSFLDELYFIIMFPLLLLVLNPQKLFFMDEGFSLTNEFFLFAIIGYSIKLAYILFLSYGLFKNPRAIKKFLINLFNIRFLRRWRLGAAKAGTEIIESSKELKTKKISFWLKAFSATVFSWTSRYWVVNAMFLAFFTVNDHALLFARQLVMWIMMLVSPTPGGSGFTEFVFSEYLGDFLPQIAGVAIVMALLWRLITYYPYLIVGAIIVPGWIRKHFSKI